MYIYIYMYISALMDGALTDGVLTCGLLADSAFMRVYGRAFTRSYLL